MQIFPAAFDMVLGVAQLYGIEMMPNFPASPYFSYLAGGFLAALVIFRWCWMRDYLFLSLCTDQADAALRQVGHIALGQAFWPCAACCSRQPACVCCGRHLARPAGALPCWGLYNGLVIALADLLEPAFKKLNTALHIPTESRGWHVFRIVRTFIIVNIGWYFDRNEFVQGCIYLRNTFTDFNLSALAANAPGAFAAVSGPAWGLVIISTFWSLPIVC